jgi:hypothetical protein
MKKVPPLGLALLLLCGSALAANKEDLYGTWHLLSDVREDVQTGAKTDNWVGNPQGYLTYGRDGRMSAIVVGGQRPKPKDLANLSDDDRIALYRTMLAYAGTFSVDGATVTHNVDISWNGNWTGTKQIRHARIEGRKLYITTDPMPSGVDGRMIIAILVWEKME